MDTHLVKKYIVSALKHLKASNLAQQNEHVCTTLECLSFARVATAESNILQWLIAAESELDEIRFLQKDLTSAKENIFMAIMYARNLRPAHCHGNRLSKKQILNPLRWVEANIDMFADGSTQNLSTKE